MEKYFASPGPLYIVSRENSYIRGRQEKLLCKGRHGKSFYIKATRSSCNIFYISRHPLQMSSALSRALKLRFPLTEEFAKIHENHFI